MAKRHGGGALQVRIQTFDAQFLRGQFDHGVLQNHILNARLAALVAQLRNFRHRQSAIIDKHRGMRRFKLLFDLRNDDFLLLKIVGHGYKHLLAVQLNGI